jgi:hypothetical protein
VIGVAGVAIAVALAFAVQIAGRPARAVSPIPQNGDAALPTTPDSYTGLYPAGAAASYAGITAFTRATGVTPNVVTYYSGWREPFKTSFANAAAEHGAVPLVQIDPTDISLAAIAGGQYDSYLTAYSEAVRAYRQPVILSFGYEMNGNWYSWGYRRTFPAVFVAAWQHIVTLFRVRGARNVSWLWAINIIHTQHKVPPPGPWWPGGSYVTWVGIDGYYYISSSAFAPLFGPTVAAVRMLTHDPILIAETAAAPATEQLAKIDNLFAGIHLYGLLGFVWFDTIHIKDWRLTSTAAIAAFRRSAETYDRFAS